MDWVHLLSSKRLGDGNYVEEPHRPIYVQDLDRIVFSAPFRRLANKTQVHPLYDHDHIHHRLIHSVETGSVGRSLGMSIGHWLEVECLVTAGAKHTIAGIVQAACLAHDIGNPPFGHSGEAAIGSWFKDQFSSSSPSGIFGMMNGEYLSHRSEFEEFEGNAQGFRILTKLEMYRNQGGMRLSKGVLGAFTKYPITSKVKNSINSDYCGAKKFGIFQTELEIFESICSELGLVKEVHSSGQWWRRHPLVFIVEAADDICYNILDIEDGFTAGDLQFEVVDRCLSPLAGASNADISRMTNEERIAYMRSRGIGAAITACVESFKDNYKMIMDGTFSGSLVEASAKANEFHEIKKIAKQRLFTAKRKTDLEVSGRNVIWQVLDGVLPVYNELMRQNWDSSKLEGYLKQLSAALQLDLRDIQTPNEALHSMTDFVSGMTDRYAIKTAKMLSGA